MNSTPTIEDDLYVYGNAFTALDEGGCGRRLDPKTMTIETNWLTNEVRYTSDGMVQAPGSVVHHRRPSICGLTFSGWALPDKFAATLTAIERLSNPDLQFLHTEKQSPSPDVHQDQGTPAVDQ